LCPDASWSLDGITFGNSTTTSPGPRGLFIDTNNTVYVTQEDENLVQVWLEGSVGPTNIISEGLDNPNSVFVTIDGNIYIAYGVGNYTIDKWTLNATSSATVMNGNGSCFGLFIDINNTLYCSISSENIVIKSPLNDISNEVQTVAGSGRSGSTMKQLDTPVGIFVNTDFNLYVADSGNNRVQFFKLGQLDGITVAGSEANGSIALISPTGVAFDADGYLFIVDCGNNRIVGSDQNGFRCVAGCPSVNGGLSNQFNNPQSLSFDSYGNMFVTDYGHQRVQKFALLTSSCSKYNNYLFKT
jgi:sugar lactone lactonase YvrE